MSVTERTAPWRDPVVWLFVAIAFAVQIAYILLADPITDIGDQVDYKGAGLDLEAWWRNPAQGVMRTPGYPFFLSPLYGWGLDDRGIQIVQAVALALPALLVADLAGRLAGRTASRIGAGLYAVYLPLLSFSSVFLSEALGIVLAILSVWAAVRAVDRPERWWGWVALATTAMAAATLVRPHFVAPAAVIVLALVLASRRSPRRAAGVAGVALVSLLVVFGPWVSRNIALTGEPHPFGNNTVYPRALGVHLPVDEDMGQFATSRRSVRFWSGARKDGFTPQRALEQDNKEALVYNVTHRPLEFARSRVIGQLQLWVWPVTANITYARSDGFPYPVTMALHLIILLAGLAGFLRYRREPVVLVGAAIVAVIAATHLVNWPQPRYALPAMPLLMVGAAAFLAPAVRRMPALRRRGVR